MWISKKKLMKECEDMIRSLEDDDWRLADWDLGYDVGYINGLRKAIKEPPYDMRLMAVNWASNPKRLHWWKSKFKSGLMTRGKKGKEIRLLRKKGK